MAGMGRLRSPVFHLITGTVAAKAVRAMGKKYRIRISPDFNTLGNSPGCLRRGLVFLTIS
jgi:hypothetical protein